MIIGTLPAVIRMIPRHSKTSSYSSSYSRYWVSCLSACATKTNAEVAVSVSAITVRVVVSALICAVRRDLSSKNSMDNLSKLFCDVIKVLNFKGCTQIGYVDIATE